ncbi:MAG: hypothetical protein A2Y17_12095 [Clostridiales bacterium GWF2_38_85]|nr:MAG: hypothetical protein A2Y17_12095 [Clostridiales bacterium GWF2_38_85]
MPNSIYGIIENCYNSFYVFRGYAPSSLLIKYSEPYNAYQRKPEDAHVEDIANFILDGQFVYTPEIVLAYSINDWFDSAINPVFYGGMIHSGSISPLDFLTFDNTIRDMLPSRTRVILKDKEKVSFTRIISGIADISMAKCTLPDSQIKPFRRIDGNHRLDAMKLLENKKAEYDVPFCIILLTNDYYNNNFDAVKTARAEMEIFHNINSKAKPLSHIEQYRGLFNLFSVPELRKFGEEFSLTKAYLEKHNNLRFVNISEFLEDKEDIVLYCIKFFLDRGATVTEDDIADVLSMLEHTYFADNELIKHCKNRFALVPYVFYCFEGGKQKSPKLAAYNTWFVKNKLYNVKDFDPASMIDVFNSIYDLRKKQIFVAMPFKPELDFVFEAICESVKKINRENDTDLLAPIRIDKQIVGFSYDIVNEMLDKIQDAGLLIADLTEQNANVYYEAGFAQGLLRAKLGNTAEILYLISNPTDPDHPYDPAKFDVDHYKIIGYKNIGNGVAELRANLEIELKAFYCI